MSCGVLAHVVNAWFVNAYLGGLVLGGSDEAESVGGHLEIGNCGVEFVDLDVLDDFSGLEMVSVLRLKCRKGSCFNSSEHHTLGSYWLTLPSS